jgi:anhydro-N-acetylmuramic acid kinase
MDGLYLGLMSGTSLDGVDAALVELGPERCELLAAATTPYPDSLRERVRTLIEDRRAPLEGLGSLDVSLGRFFAECALGLIQRGGRERGDIVAIGHSGHTVFHQPASPDPFTMQLGDANVVAACTGISTVADFRGMDVALGGQGAPLVPAFHRWRFATPGEVRVIINIGGIANLTRLHPQDPLVGFDSGPGNALMDGWCRRCKGEPFDRGGDWARSGKMDAALLERFRADAYFARRPPKSTGVEHFDMAWIERRLDAMDEPVADEDVQATLLELTASTIADAVITVSPDIKRAVLCGGGAHNTALVARLSRLLPAASVDSSAAHGIEPEWVEAVAFAWLARARLRREPGNVPTVTGARQEAVLGALYSSGGVG